MIRLEDARSPRHFLSAFCFLAAVCACDDAGRDDPDERSEDNNAVPTLCERDERFPVRSEGLAPADDYDYVAIRLVPEVLATTGPEEWVLRNFETVSEAGEACGEATNDACNEKIAFHPSPSVGTYCGHVCVEWSLVTTKGDEVRHWIGDEILVALGEIDRPDDAMMVVMSKGYALECPSTINGYPREVRPRVRVVEDGFEVTATRYVETCPFVIRQYRLHVSHDGVVEELDAEDYPWDVCA